MKASLRWIIAAFIVCLIYTLTPSAALAQTDPDEGNLPCVGPDPTYGDCPIDSGLVLLLIAGAGYGIKKVVDARKSAATAGEEA